MNRKVLVFNDADKISSYAAKDLIELSKRTINERGGFTVAFSGGKTPIKLYRALAKSKEIMWTKVHIFMVDERFVPLDDADSNYRMIKNILLDNIDIPKNNIHNIPIKETVEISADRYENELIDFFKLKKRQIPVFDLILLGIGKDGHTASLFPDDDFARKQDRIAIPVELTGLRNKRISLNLSVINNAKNVIFLVSQKNKYRVLKEIVHNKNSNLPASLVKPKNGKLSFLIAGKDKK